MRTTIEMKDEHRARLLQLAALRGEKGFSRLVAEAIEAFLDAQVEADERRERALLVKGSLAEKEAEEMRGRVREIREQWR